MPYHLSSTSQEVKNSLVSFFNDLTQMEECIRRDVSMSLSIEFQAGFKRLNRNIQLGKTEISQLMNQIPSDNAEVQINLKPVTDQISLTKEAYQSFMRQHAS